MGGMKMPLLCALLALAAAAVTAGLARPGSPALMRPPPVAALCAPFGYGVCTACKDCSACGHCKVRGGVCTVCK